MLFWVPPNTNSSPTDCKLGNARAHKNGGMQPFFLSKQSQISILCGQKPSPSFLRALSVFFSLPNRNLWSKNSLNFILEAGAFLISPYREAKEQTGKLQLENVCKENKRGKSDQPTSLSCSHDFYIHMISPITQYDINRAILSALNVFKTFLAREIYLWNHPLASISCISWNRDCTVVLLSYDEKHNCLQSPCMCDHTHHYWCSIK